MPDLPDRSSQLRSATNFFQPTMAANGGGADSAVAQPSRDVQESVLARPARKQISFAELDAIRSHSERSVPGMTYNIWYNKMSGGDSSDPFMNKEKSKTRCNIAQDLSLIHI